MEIMSPTPFAQTLTPNMASPMSGAAVPVATGFLDVMAQQSEEQMSLVPELSGDALLVQQTTQRVGQKEKALQNFLVQMQAELDVSPEAIIAAFGKMDTQDLKVAPEDSVRQFVSNLDLAPEDERRATEIYGQLLAVTSAIDLSGQLQQKGQSADIKVLSPDQILKRQRIEKLNDLSDRFFVTGDYSRGGREVAVPMAAAKLSSAPPPVTMVPASAVAPSAPAPSDSRLTANADLTASPVPQVKAGVDTANSDLNLADLTPTDVTPTEYGDLTEGILQQKLNLTDATGVDSAGAAPVGAAEAGMGFANDEETLDSESNPDLSGQERAANDLGAVKTQELKGKTFTLGSPTPTPSEMKENIREIIRGAQVMVQDGGGEMKMKLKPEGLGELNLKVLVKGSEVSVEVLTASDEAKKILEKGLHELKSSLSAQKLSVEHIRIDTAQSIPQQMLQDRQDSLERNFQQRFLQDFMQQNQERRGQTWGVGPARVLSSQTQEPASNELEAASRRRAAQRRLDLVA
jgi:flagellar hook-length control protein FliK